VKRPPYAAVVAVTAATVASLVAAVPAVSVTAAEVRMERTVKTACCDLQMTVAALVECPADHTGLRAGWYGR